MGWLILTRWRKSAPNTPDPLAILRAIREFWQLSPEVKAQMAKDKQLYLETKQALDRMKDELLGD